MLTPLHHPLKRYQPDCFLNDRKYSPIGFRHVGQEKMYGKILESYIFGWLPVKTK